MTPPIQWQPAPYNSLLPNYSGHAFGVAKSSVKPSSPLPKSSNDFPIDLTFAVPSSPYPPNEWQRRAERNRLARLKEIEFEKELRIQANPKLSGFEFVLEMIFGLGRGAERMAHDTKEHPGVVLGTVGTIVGLTYLLPNPYAKYFSRAIMVLGCGVSGGMMVKGLASGINAWQTNDPEGLYDASATFGVGALSLFMTYGGIKLGERFSQNPNVALRWGLVGNLLHSTDEIALGLAIFQGTRKAPVFQPYAP